jgi:flagellar basal-body rod modification protein FlgD
MSTVNGVNQTTTTAATTTTATQREVSSTDFMKLLVAQLQNQDPTNPVDNQDFLGQLATFNSLEQLVSIKDSMSTLAENQDTSNKSLEQLELINKNLEAMMGKTDTSSSS